MAQMFRAILNTFENARSTVGFKSKLVAKVTY